MGRFAEWLLPPEEREFAGLASMADATAAAVEARYVGGAWALLSSASAVGVAAWVRSAHTARSSLSGAGIAIAAAIEALLAWMMEHGDNRVARWFEDFADGDSRPWPIPQVVGWLLLPVGLFLAFLGVGLFFGSLVAAATWRGLMGADRDPDDTLAGMFRGALSDRRGRSRRRRR
jgi:hypothetical protein